MPNAPTRATALACILQSQTAFTTIATGTIFWTILGISVAIIRPNKNRSGKPVG